MSLTTNCRMCASSDMVPMIDFGNQPVAHNLPKEKDERKPTFPFAIVFCKDCSLVQVVEAVSPGLLYKDFNFNFSSWKPEPHIPDELDLIFNNISPKNVLEVGANDGRFLSLLQERGVKTCTGIEPNAVSGQLARDKGFTIYEDFLNQESAERILKEQGQFDLIVFRQVLEHIPDPRGFLKAVEILLKPEGHIFVDVPDFEPTCAIGDATTLWEEHVLYFSRKTLTHLFALHGFKPVESAWYDFSGGCLAMLATRNKDGDPINNVESLSSSVATFSEKYQQYHARIHAFLAKQKAKGKKIVMYGAGVRAAAVSNFLGLGEYIDFALDDQKERQGLFLPGFNIEISSPDILKDGNYICLLAVNNENEAKVSANVANISPETPLLSVCGPADIWSALEKMENSL